MGSLRPCHQAFFFLNLSYFPPRLFLTSFFCRILKASPLTNSFFNIWRVTRGEMCVQEGFRLLKCVFASGIDFSLSLVPLYTTVSKNSVSASNVSAVNSIVG